MYAKRPGSRARRLVAGIVGGLLLAGSSVTADSSAGGLVPGGPDPDLSLIYTGDVIGYLDPCG